MKQISSTRVIILPLLTFQLKAFYVDLLVPLETNLEKDTKVVQVRKPWKMVPGRELLVVLETLLPATLNNAMRGMDFQSEQKKFLQQHKTRSETYSKAAATMKKQRKKSRAANKSGLAMDKELKNMQILEEEKTKLDAFCEQSLKNVSNEIYRAIDHIGFIESVTFSVQKRGT